MDADRFDTLTRSLTDARSRRGALATLLGGTLGLFGLSGTAAKKRKKKKKKKGGIPYSPPPSDTSPPPCIPSCSGKSCGDDGCGGSCGPCVGGSCSNGACICPNGTERCGSGCVANCQTGDVRNPNTCVCCRPNGGSGCGLCCSNRCVQNPNDPGGPFICVGKDYGQPCQFNEQCASNRCFNGACSCPSGTPQRCGSECFPSCDPGDIRNPNICVCYDPGVG